MNKIKEKIDKKIISAEVGISNFLAKKRAGNDQYVGAAFLLIIAVVVAVIFRTQIANLVNSIFTKLTTEMDKLW